MKNNEQSCNSIFTDDIISENAPVIYPRKAVTAPAAIIESDQYPDDIGAAKLFSDEIAANKIADFEKVGVDKMCHVSTFIYTDNSIYVTYYANTQSGEELPTHQVARLAYAPENDIDNKTVLDIMQVGESLFDKKITGVYDTILMQRKDTPNELYVMWTASVDNKYYRLYRIFNTATHSLGEVRVNRFKVGNTVNDFSSSGITNALAANGIGYKELFSDIGIMQKLSSRVENGEVYYYSGAYSGSFTCIIKSKDLITWEYVAQPNEGTNGTGFDNETKWENAVYALNDRVYYFVRQWDYDEASKAGSKYGILTYYDLESGEWAKPVLVADCQSRSDFIFYNNELYLFYAPTDREHIGILKINTEDISKSSVVLRADMKGSCFYPFVQYNSKGQLCMSYTVDRRHIRLASFTMEKYVGKASEN